MLFFDMIVLSVYVVGCCVFFFFKQKTAYEMRISDWSSDVCSSDLLDPVKPLGLPHYLLDRYSLWKGELLDGPAIFILPQDNSIGGVEEYLKHRDQMRRRLDGGLLILVLEDVPAATRRRLVEKRGESGRASCRERVSTYV